MSGLMYWFEARRRQQVSGSKCQDIYDPEDMIFSEIKE